MAFAQKTANISYTTSFLCVSQQKETTHCVVILDLPLKLQ